MIRGLCLSVAPPHTAESGCGFREREREGLEPSAQDLSHISNTSWLPAILWEIIFSCKKRVVKRMEKGRGMKGKKRRRGSENSPV